MFEAGSQQQGLGGDALQIVHALLWWHTGVSSVCHCQGGSVERASLSPGVAVVVWLQVLCGSARWWHR